MWESIPMSAPDKVSVRRFFTNYLSERASWHSIRLMNHRLSTTYFHSLLRIYIPSRSLRSASEQRLVVPSQRGSKSLSRTFSFTIFPLLSGMLDPSQSSSNNWKLLSFDTTWLHPKKILHPLLPLLAPTYLNNVWDLVLLALPLYVCLFKMNRFMYSPIVSRIG